MNKWARIEDSVVKEIISFNPSGKFHNSLVWEQCVSDVEVGWIRSSMGNFVKPGKIKEDVLEGLKEKIAAKRRSENSKTFKYKSVDYVSDEGNIVGVAVRIQDLPDSAKIPTFKGTQLEGTWKSADNQFIPFNVKEFKDFANFYYDHREKNFTNSTNLLISAIQLYNQGASTDTLESLDISTGWV